MIEYPLDLAASLAYAKRWAMLRNPAYYDFDDTGGDCTNFVSQCLYAGGAAMNYTRDTGWYYISQYDRAAAWTSVEYFYKFIVTNKGIGPFGHIVPLRQVRTGDIIQLGVAGRFYHSLFVVNMRGGVPHVAAHTNDVYDRAIFAYVYEDMRCIRIDGSRKYS